MVKCKCKTMKGITLKFKLANIFCDSNAKAIQFPTLYCRANAHFSHINNGVKLEGAGTFDFTTYFNAVSAKKWQLYASLNNISLHLELNGGKGTITLTRADQFSFEAEKISGTEMAFDATKETFVVDLPLTLDADMLAFEIDTDSSTEICNSYYFTNVSEENLNNVELALCTTTFKKEEFIIPNAKMIHEEILMCDEEIANHFTMHIVDNGRTLSENVIPNDQRILLHPNKNAGGAGGFARGMIEAKHQEPKATHVLLMDDDVQVSPESIKRTFALLRLVNDEYKDAFVGGAMHEFDYPHKQMEDSAYVNGLGKLVQSKKKFDITSLMDCVASEVCSNSRARYAAWWYCVIPMQTIEEFGLPLPLFIRADDVEYGYRCNKKIMTMNSISICHKGFDLHYDAAVERYTTIRNIFIANAITGCASKEQFMAHLHDAMVVELKKFSYKNATLTLEGFEDFMKGPSFIMEKGMTERKFLEKHEECEHLKPLDEALLDAPKKQRGSVISQINRVDAELETPRNFTEKIKDKLTLNNQKVPLPINKKGCIVIPISGWLYKPGKFLGAKSFFAVDFLEKKAIYRKKNKKKFRKIWKRYKNDLKTFKKIENDLYAEYAACRDEITSEEFWRDYLGI